MTSRGEGECGAKRRSGAPTSEWMDDSVESDARRLRLFIHSPTQSSPRAIGFSKIPAAPGADGRTDGRVRLEDLVVASSQSLTGLDARRGFEDDDDDDDGGGGCARSSSSS